MKNTVVTIGRQFGSGGHEIGLRLAKKLGMAFYDKELLAIEAEKTGYNLEYLANIDEKRIVPSFAVTWPYYGGVPVDYGGVSAEYGNHIIPNYQINEDIKAIMGELAEKSSCVIVGRCSDVVLKKFNSINIFVHAPIEARVARMKAMIPEKEQKKDKVWKKEIRLIDKKRSKYYAFYGDQRWGESGNYHLCIDSSKVGIDGAVDLIVELISKFGDNDILPD